MKSLFLDPILITNFTYIKFKGKADDYHLNLTCKTLKKLEINSAREITKEKNILGKKTKYGYLKSTGYYYNNLIKLGEEASLFNKLTNEKITSKKEVDFNSLIFAYEYSKINSSILITNYRLDYYELSSHKRLLVELLLLKNNKTNKESILNNIETDLNTKLTTFILNNSFEKNKKNGSSHEYGYWLNYVLDFYIMIENKPLLTKLNHLFENLHLIFVKYKVYYHDVIGKNKKLINISGLILIAKAMLRFSIITKDLRFANVAFHLIDIIKKLQLINNGFIQNTLPIYKGNSKLKFPSWTLNYFLEVLILKKEVVNEFKDSIFN